MSTVSVVVKNNIGFSRGRLGDGATSYNVNLDEYQNLVREDLLTSTVAPTLAQLRKIACAHSGDKAGPLD